MVVLTYFFSLCTTFAIELPIIYYLFKYHGETERHHCLKAGCVAQLITHPTSFLIIPTLAFYLNVRLNLGNPFWVRLLNNFVFYEFIIPLVEGWFYAGYLKPSKKYRAYLFSLVANMASWGLGALVDDRKIAEWILMQSFFY